MSTEELISAREYFEAKLGRMSLGRCLKIHREDLDLSQVEFAKKLKITRSHLCDIEKERKLVGPERAVRFAKILKVPEILFLKLSLQDLLHASNLKYKVDVEKAG